MTLTIKEPLELTSPGKPGSPSQNSENRSSESPRSNPVCLEVPITVRSLPGENWNASGAAGPSREEGRTVIVFDIGAILRLSSNLTPGQSVILSNAQGRDVVCRVTNSRNLPTIKGYIEVEFMEPVNDFWRIRQTGEPASVPPPPAPVLTLPQPIPVVPPAARPVAPHVVTPEKEAAISLGSAPSFDDIAGLVRMSPPPAAREKTSEPAGRIGSLKRKDESTHGQIEAAKPAYTDSTFDPVSEVTSKNLAIPVAREFSSLPAHKPAPSDEILGRTVLSASQSSLASSSAGSRGPMPFILGGAALVLAGFGAAYLFMHRGIPTLPAASSAVAAQPSGSTLSAPSSTAEAAQIAQPVAEQASAQPQPVSTIPTVTTEAKPSTPPAAESLRLPTNNTDLKEPDRASKQRQQMPGLKMSSPSAPRANSAKLSNGSAPAVTDIASAIAIGGAPTAAMLPSVVRSENQPAPPSLGSPAPPIKTVRQPTLISSTRPAYPPMAKQSNIQGTVVVSADVDVRGIVTGVKAISGPTLLREAAIDAVKRWKYSPALIDGKPVAAQVSVAVEFRLN